MKKAPVVLDLETKFLYRDVNYDRRRLGISVVGLYDYASDAHLSFEENELNKLFSYLENSSYIVGFNINSFDLPILQAYYPGKLSQFATFDLLDDVREKIGRRLGLNDLTSATLNKKKSGHGLQAIDLYKDGKIEELKRYCLDDVRLTKELLEQGAEKGEIYYLNEKGRSPIKVEWKKYLAATSANDTHLTLPF